MGVQQVQSGAQQLQRQQWRYQLGMYGPSSIRHSGTHLRALASTPHVACHASSGRTPAGSLPDVTSRWTADSPRSRSFQSCTHQLQLQSRIARMS